MRTKTYVIFFIIILLLFSLKLYRSSISTKLTLSDLHTIEHYTRFKFPDSTKTVSAYWDMTESEKLYLSFEFDKNDIEKFMETLKFSKNDFLCYDGDSNWRIPQDPNEVAYSADQVFKKNRVMFSDDTNPELLVWWKPNKGFIRWIYNIRNAKLKDANVFFKQYILVEECKKSYKVYVFMKWDALEDSEPYMKNIRSVFPWHSDWKYREKFSLLYPFKQADKGK